MGWDGWDRVVAWGGRAWWHGGASLYCTRLAPLLVDSSVTMCSSMAIKSLPRPCLRSVVATRKHLISHATSCPAESRSNVAMTSAPKAPPTPCRIPTALTHSGSLVARPLVACNTPSPSLMSVSPLLKASAAAHCRSGLVGWGRMVDRMVDGAVDGMVDVAVDGGWGLSGMAE